VDAFAPKVVRSTAGSLWHVELFQEITFDSLMKCAEQCDTPIFATDTDGELSILDMTTAQRSRVIWVFGNEARGIPEEWKVKRVSIPMSGGAESLNLASAAAVVMFTSSN
jgi:TrmH family RNA methyltransferase